jgi:hypothetical protein
MAKNVITSQNKNINGKGQMMFGEVGGGFFND